MTTKPFAGSCDCCSELNRRQFLRTTLGGIAAVATASPLSSFAEKSKSTPETLVSTLYKSLTEQQRKSICFGFDDPLRNKVDNNWHITKPKIAEFLTKDQNAMVREIFDDLHSPEYADIVYKQVEHDSGKEGFGSSSIALFGQPGSGKFEFVLTGRHCTRRCDGDSVEGAAFGGPIFYGHAAESFNEKATHPGNAYWFQAIRANEVFQMFNGKQQEMALLDAAPEEKGTDTVKLSGKLTGLPGIPMTELTRDQKDHVRMVMADLLAPFRKADADEAMKLIEKNGFDHLHLAFYKQDDIGNDRVWDIWQIEGPAMLWYFRGAPHVHTWVHVREHV